MNQFSRDIKYLSRDFNTFRQSLIDYTKSYFPNVYNDFSDAQPGMMYLELSAYVGDVLSYYTDNQLKESLANLADERFNLVNIAQNFGYKPKNIVPSMVNVDVYQLVPSLLSGSIYTPDWSYALIINSGMEMTAPSYGAKFRTINTINFNQSSSYDPTSINVYRTDTSNNPTYFLLKKSTLAVSGEIKTVSFTFGAPKRYDKVVINDTDIIEILDITDSDGNIWYEVPYLSQDTVVTEELNTSYNSAFSDSVNDAPFITKLTKTSRRFISRINADNTTTIQFGAGVNAGDDELIIPNPTLVGNSLYNNNLTYSIDPSNFLYTKTYGLAPSNTTLTIRYTVGGGVNSNVPANSITNINNIEFQTYSSVTSTNMLQFVQNSVGCNNSEPASGGKSSDSIEEIRINTLASFAAQNRAVTAEDYIVRCYSMPPKFGSVAKAFILKNKTDNFTLDLYVLGLSQTGTLTIVSNVVKQNLKKYLQSYRMLTDSVNIKNAYIVNIGINFSVTVLPGFNSNEVLLKCIAVLKTMFNISNWSINQPIMLSNIYTELDNVSGVQTVVNVSIQNLYDEDLGYSNNIYNIQAATKNGVIYPSFDPCIFEVKYPNKDIQGRVIST